MTPFERNVIGTIIGAESKTDIIDDSGLAPEMFSTVDGKTLYAMIQAMHTENIIPTLAHIFDKNQDLALKYNDVTDASNFLLVKDSIKNIKKDYKYRCIKRIESVVKDATPNNLEDKKIEIMSIIDQSDDINFRNDLKDIATRENFISYVDKVEARYRNHGKVDGVDIKFQNMKGYFNEFTKGNIYYIGARPSDGKSTLAMNIGIQSLQLGYKVGFISLETGRDDLMNRITSHIGGIEVGKLKTGQLSPKDFASLQEVGELLDKSEKFLIYDKPRATISDVVSAMKLMVRRHKVEIIFVDYVQIIHAPRFRTKIEEVSHCSQVLKETARVLNIPVVALGQLKRDVDDGRMPTLGDFQWSSQLEQDMDGGMLIWNVNPNRSEPFNDDYYILYAKNRDGKTGWVRMRYSKAMMTFDEHMQQIPPPIKRKGSHKAF
jgi:replicative DNA helicase